MCVSNDFYYCSFSVFAFTLRFAAVSKCIPAIPAYIKPRSENEKRVEESEEGSVQFAKFTKLVGTYFP